MSNPPTGSASTPSGPTVNSVPALGLTGVPSGEPWRTSTFRPASMPNSVVVGVATSLSLFVYATPIIAGSWPAFTSAAS